MKLDWPSKMNKINRNHKQAIESILEPNEYQEYFEPELNKFGEQVDDDKKFANSKFYDSYLMESSPQHNGLIKGDESDSSDEINEKELTLLFCGDHQNYFEAKDVY